MEDRRESACWENLHHESTESRESRTTGSPLTMHWIAIAGEERAKEVFGDYVSICDFRQSIRAPTRRICTGRNARRCSSMCTRATRSGMRVFMRWSRKDAVALDQDWPRRRATAALAR